MLLALTDSIYVSAFEVWSVGDCIIIIIITITKKYQKVLNSNDKATTQYFTING
jgi:hypothetical protein